MHPLRLPDTYHLNEEYLSFFIFQSVLVITVYPFLLPFSSGREVCSSDDIKAVDRIASSDKLAVDK